ncbi:thiamine-phosphate synthase family protein [Caldivirga sp. UBA161]|uniref:thiamine-phosphate synthase family protein n=1 Tax=Caldivirga sp. UBA161 TaxID=1915569 RepID=UPI0025C0C57C|nr:thiamine-phosphate synthase family protein [Caldivirga sp. UBA161]
MLNLGLEFLVDEVIPLIKAEVARELAERGYSQSRIAKILGVTQPMVNRLMNQYEYYVEKARKLNLWDMVVNVSRAVVEMITNDRYDDASKYIMNTLLMDLAGLRLCNAHRMVKVDIPANCNVCSILVMHRDAVIMNVEEAIKILEANPEVSLLVPGVLMNIAEAIPNPRDSSDVAAVPGRIDKVNGRVKAWNPPTYGASGHLAMILIGISRNDPSTRAVASVRWGSDVEEAIKALGWSMVKTSGSMKPSEEEVISRVVSAYVASKPKVVADTGGYGVEPITYVFGSNAVEVALSIVSLAKEAAKLAKK